MSPDELWVRFVFFADNPDAEWYEFAWPQGHDYDPDDHTWGGFSMYDFD